MKKCFLADWSSYWGRNKCLCLSDSNNYLSPTDWKYYWCFSELSILLNFSKFFKTESCCDWLINYNKWLGQSQKTFVRVTLLKKLKSYKSMVTNSNLPFMISSQLKIPFWSICYRIPWNFEDKFYQKHPFKIFLKFSRE